MVNLQDNVREFVSSQDLSEGRISRMIDQQSAKIPSGVWWSLAYASIAGSLAIAVSKKNPSWANFVGLWAPSFMLIGIYNKMVKQHGSDQTH